MKPRSFPVKDSLPGEAGIPQGLASLPPLVEIRNVTSHCPGACQPRSTQAPPAEHFLGSARVWLGAPLRGSLTQQQHILHLTASVSSDEESYKQRPGLCSINRITKSQRPFGVWVQAQHLRFPWGGQGLAPASGLPPPTKETIAFFCSKKHQAQSSSQQAAECQIILVSLEYDKSLQGGTGKSGWFTQAVQYQHDKNLIVFLGGAEAMEQSDFSHGEPFHTSASVGGLSLPGSKTACGWK